MGRKKSWARGSAVFSEDRKYRYWLVRSWDITLPMCAFIGLNPSTADESKDDPTVRRCINYARAWGYGGMYMLNLFAFRATDPRALVLVDDPVGPYNDSKIIEAGKSCALVVAAWGAHGATMNRDVAVRNILEESRVPLSALGFTREGHPRHPLYLSKEAKPEEWRSS